MARAFQQSELADPARDGSSSEWKSLRSELVALLNQVDSQVTRARPETPLSERVRDLRFQVAETEVDPSNRHRDALKSVQRAITRFEEPAPQIQPNPRDSLQAAISQIRSRQDPRPAPRPAPQDRSDGSLLEGLAHAVTGLSGRLERLEGEIRTQIKTGANVRDVADQVAQLAHVVELLAGAVGETGQVKRLEGQIASLGKIMSQGREMDIQTLTRRLDDVASTVGKLAELQVHYVDRVENPVASQAFKDGMASIESSVRNVYDRIDALERQHSLSPEDIDHVTSEMSRFTEVLRENTTPPQNLIELVDALNSRISDIESGDRLLHGLRKDLTSLRDAIVVSVAPRFDAIEQRLDAMTGAMGTREDFATLGRQLEGIGSRIGEHPIDPGIGPLEAQVRQLVARMDQTGEQLSGLAKLYAEPTAMMPDLGAMAEMVASRAAEAVQRSSPDASLAETINGLEGRIGAMLKSMHRGDDDRDFGDMQAGIGEVNERLKRLELSLAGRLADPSTALVALADPPDARATSARAVPPAERPQSSNAYDIAAIIAEADYADQVTVPLVDVMPRSPAEDMPLTAPAFPEPVGPVQSALDAKNGPRKRHPGLETDEPLASRHELASRPAVPANVEPPPPPQPSPGFFEPLSGAAGAAETSSVPASSRNTFIEAARRAAQRQTAGKPKPEAAGHSLIGRALSRFHTGGDVAPLATPTDLKASEPKARTLAGDKPARTKYTPEPVEPAAGPAVSLEPQIHSDGQPPKPVSEESFLLRNRKVILLGAAVVALAFLTINLVAQRLASEPGPAAATPISTGDIGDAALPAEMTGETTEVADGGAPRVIPMVDSVKTGSIDTMSTQAFTTSPLQPMPSAFQAATDLASVDSTMIAPLVPTVSPVKVELPPEAIGPMDLREAAANGDPRAQFEVAAIYTEGRAVKQDYALAATWYERAAVSGFAPAEYRLGSLYENGQGVEKDINTARLWYERAAEAGNRMSMHNLAALYAGGQLGKQQFDSAAKWFEEAASRGLTDSQFNLGMLYARGLGVPQNLEGSFKWFGIAALSGDKDAAKARDDIARSLDAEAVNRLTAEIVAFKAQAIDLAANFAPIGTWTGSFDPGETIATRDIVASVQKALGRLGYDVGTPDGIAGPKTAVAIKHFEQATGMSEVGLINPRLLAVLGSQPV